MPIDMTRCKNINQQDYYKVIRRTVIMNADDGDKLSGYKFWQWFKKNVKVTIIPVADAWKYKQFFEHIPGIDDRVSKGIPWGKAGMRELIWAVNDKYNPLGFYIRQNVPPGVHELLHVIYQELVGTMHVQYQSSEPPEVIRLPQSGPAATVIVHDNWYGFKTRLRMWISWAPFIYLPLSIPYIPVKKGKEMYNV